MVDYYSILDLSTGASQEEIRKAYRSKAKQYHPDVNSSDDAHQAFVQIQKAYQVLSNPHTKIPYDAERRKHADPLYSYEEWAARIRQKREREAIRRQQDLLRRKKEIQESRMYYPYIIGMYFITLFALSICVIALVYCAIIIFSYHLLMFFFLLPFICMATYILKFSYDKYRETRAMFASA